MLSMKSSFPSSGPSSGLRNMFNMLDEYEEEVLAAAKAISEVVVPGPTVILPEIPKFIMVDAFDSNCNVLDEAVKRRFIDDVKFPEHFAFTQPIPTTITMEGLISNVKFMEEELIKEVVPNDQVLSAHCNYGRIVYDGYDEPVNKKSALRLKKLRAKKPRKEQGTGECFNSQITFPIRSGLSNDMFLQCEVNSVLITFVPTTEHVFKMKVFRTGKLQIPGVRPDIINVVLEKTELLTRYIDELLHYGEHDASKRSNLINVSPVMLNYKCLVKMAPMEFLNLAKLKTILDREKINRPDIFYIKYSRDATKLSIKFSTPIPRKPKKRVRINFHQRGKFNVLGGHSTESTLAICTYLSGILMEHAKDIIVPVGPRYVFAEPPPLVDNIDTEFTYEDCEELWAQISAWPPVGPTIPVSDYHAVFDLIGLAWGELNAVVGRWLAELNALPIGSLDDPAPAQHE